MVSTDCPDIAAAAEAAGAEVPFMRPADLAGDRSSELLAWRHAIEEMNRRGTALDLFLSVPATAPLRAPEDIDRAVERFLELQGAGTPADLVLTVTEARANPYFSMVRIAEAPWLALAAETGATGPTRRQDAPAVFEIVPVAYVAAPSYVMHTSHLLAGRVAHVLIPPERALDIDTPFDLHLADLLLRHPFPPADIL
jgi:N-acylneuraminate cytidylyltransferase